MYNNKKERWNSYEIQLFYGFFFFFGSGGKVGEE